MLINIIYNIMYSNNRHKKMHYKGGGLFDNFVKKVFPDVNLDEYRYELHYYKKDGNIIKYDSIDLNTPISNILNFSVGDDVEIVFPYSPKPNNEDMVLSTKISLKNQGITPELLQNCCPDKIIKIGEIPNKVIHWNEYEQNNLDTPIPDYETNLQRIPNVISWKTQNRKLNKEDIPEGTQLDSDIDLDDTEYGAALLLSMKKDNETNSPSPIEEKETEDINRENQEVYEDARGIEAAEEARLVLREMDRSEYTTNTDSTLSGGGKKSKRKPNKSKEFDHNLQIKIIQVQNDNEKEKLSFILQSNNGEKYKENILRKMLKDGKFSMSETEELLNAIKYMPFAIENVDTKKFENIQIRYFPDKIKENEAMKNSISKIKKELVDLHLLKLQKEIH
ncbi:MAG: hypothetical protein CMD75_04805, partial [Gammaproteobacteria bacterium]|nr:hypothetical protein [Gammaproteobacteria bacterium]